MRLDTCTLCVRCSAVISSQRKRRGDVYLWHCHVILRNSVPRTYAYKSCLCSFTPPAPQTPSFKKPKKNTTSNGRNERRNVLARGASPNKRVRAETSPSSLGYLQYNTKHTGKRSPTCLHHTRYTGRHLNPFLPRLTFRRPQPWPEVPPRWRWRWKWTWTWKRSREAPPRSSWRPR